MKASRFLGSGDLRHVRCGLALGFFIPASRAVFLALTGGIRGDLLFEVTLLGLLAGLVGLPPRAGIPPRGRGLLLAMLPVVPAAAAFAQGFPLPDLVRWVLAALAAVAAFIFLLVLGRMCREQLEHPAHLVLNLLAASLGLVLAAILMPLLGATMLLAAALGALALGVKLTRYGWRWYGAAAFALLAALAVLDRPAVQSEIARRGGWEAPVTRRVWYADGPGTIRHLGRRWMETSVSSGRLTWVTPRRWESILGNRAEPSASAAVAGALATRGSALLLGPAAAASWLHVSASGVAATVLMGDRRLAWWYRASLPGTTIPPEEAVEQVSGNARSFLAGKRGRFDLVYYVDPYEREALASGSVGRRPAFHLTVEAVKAYLDALTEDGYLVLEVPYSLKVVTTLREIGRRDGFPLVGNLLVAGDPATGKDVVVFRKSPLEAAQIELLTAIMKERGGTVHYRPGDRLMVNAVVRLVWTLHPRWHYASGTDEFSPPTDERPFFYKVQKLIPRTWRKEVIGLTPLQSGRLLGVLPEGDLPWVVFVGLGLLAGFTLFLRRARMPWSGDAPATDWRYRFFVFFVLFGVSLGLSTVGGLMALSREYLAGHLVFPVGAGLALAGLALGLRSAGGAGGAVSSWTGWVLLPLALLPLLAGLAGEAPTTAPARAGLLLLCLIPYLVFAGRVLSATLVGNRNHGSFPAGSCLGYLGLGVLIGREVAVPLMQTFGLSFMVVLGWVVLFVSLRMYRRIPAASPPGSG